MNGGAGEIMFDFKFPKYSSRWSKVSKEIKDRDNYTCRRCGAVGKQRGGVVVVQAAHVVPRSQGGRDTVKNGITLCVACHAGSKGHSHMRANPVFKKELAKRRKVSLA